MSLFFNRDPSIEAPFSGRNRVSVIWLWLGLLGAPVAWVAQLLLSEPFAAYACFPIKLLCLRRSWQVCRKY